MADNSGEERDAQRRERRSRRREHNSRRERGHESLGRDDIVQGPDIEDLRKARLDFYANSGEGELSKRTGGSKVEKMASASTSRASVSSSKRHKPRHSSEKEDESRRHRKSRSKDTREKVSTEEHVYVVDGERIRETTTTYIEKKKDSRNVSPDGEDSMSDIQEEADADEYRIIYVEKEKPRSSRHESTRRDSTRHSTRHEDRERARSDAHYTSRKPIAEPESPKSIHRTSSRHVADTGSLRRSHSHGPRPRQSYAESNASAPNKRSSMFAGFFNPPASQQPIKLTHCVVCLADDIPSTRSAKLKCGHRMCHSCLKRSFKLSITDPQHMPPKCCTSDHIPLHHVENLFDLSFKKQWNRKFHEYTTKNRIYCPSRRCGEWIKPANIHKDKDGKKYGLCGTCKTKVCCVCNGKWHGSKDCPKDEETNRLLETAKKAGWQRCFDCRTMIELKEGCNHMTCRCKAEFCMICGAKWKTCNCPWFNYETVEADRLLHMRVPEDAYLMPRPRARTYEDEISARRRQERADEILARRFGGLGIVDRGFDDDYNGGIGDIMGIGNGAAHFMNESFRRPGLVNYSLRDRRPPPTIGRYMPLARPEPPSHPSPRIRSRDMIDRYPPPANPVIRKEIIEETLVRAPSSSRRDRERSSKTREPSAARPPERSRSLAVRGERPSSDKANSLGSGELAGLNTSGSGGGTGRVKAWRAHVEPGVAPDEGLLNTPL